MTALISISLLYLIIAARYLLVSGALQYYLRKSARGFKKIRSKAQTPTHVKKEITASLFSSVWFALSGFLVVLWLQDGRAKVFWGLEPVSLICIPVGLAVYLFIHDAWFYFTHRALHRPWLFKKIHYVHHVSVRPTAYAALSFHWAEALLEASFIPMMILIVPIHGIALISLLTLMTVFGALNHSSYEPFPASLTRSSWAQWILTPTHHTQHHEKFNGNYSLYFTWWDRWLNTQFKDYEKRFDEVHRGQ